MTAHIRHRMPRKRGNSFYRDKTDYTRFCKTLCGATVTDKDIDYATANTKKFRVGWAASTCPACLAKQDEMQAAVIAALPNVMSRGNVCAGCHALKADHIDYGRGYLVCPRTEGGRYKVIK